jgi:hypothetical protein
MRRFAVGVVYSSEQIVRVFLNSDGLITIQQVSNDGAGSYVVVEPKDVEDLGQALEFALREFKDAQSEHEE